MSNNGKHFGKGGNFNRNTRSAAPKSYGIFGEDEDLPVNKFPIQSLKMSSKSPQKEEVINSRQDDESNQNSFFAREAKERHQARPTIQAPVPQKQTQAHAPTSRNFFVFDIETIPCAETVRQFLGLQEDVNDDEAILKLTAYHNEITGGQNDFHRQLFHKVVCVSFIAGTIQTMKGGREKYIIKTIRSGGRNKETEKEILEGVFSYLGKHPSRLISFNGRGFDMPVLQYRAMKYGIDARWIYSDGYYNYNHRYSIEKHCDLLEMFSNFGASARVKMAEVCSLFGIPCKNGGVDGSSVYGLYKEDKLSEIADYCETDVIATYLLYLRFMQHSGRLSADGYDVVVKNLLDMLQKEDSPAHHKLFAAQFLEQTKGNPYIKNSPQEGREDIATEENNTEENTSEHNEEPIEEIEEQNSEVESLTEADFIQEEDVLEKEEIHSEVNN